MDDKATTRMVFEPSVLSAGVLVSDKLEQPNWFNIKESSGHQETQLPRSSYNLSWPPLM